MNEHQRAVMERAIDRMKQADEGLRAAIDNLEWVIRTGMNGDVMSAILKQLQKIKNETADVLTLAKNRHYGTEEADDE